MTAREVTGLLRELGWRASFREYVSRQGTGTTSTYVAVSSRSGDWRRGITLGRLADLTAMNEEELKELVAKKLAAKEGKR